MAAHRNKFGCGESSDEEENISDTEDHEKDRAKIQEPVPMKNNLFLSSYNWKNSDYFADLKLSKDAFRNLKTSKDEYIMKKIIDFEDKFTKIDINARLIIDRAVIVAL